MAAGNSSRMGVAKQLLPWKKTFLLNHAINTANCIDNVTTYVVLGANSAMITPEIQHKDIEIIYNPKWEIGLGSSIAFGVKTLMDSEHNFDGVLILLSDQPLIDANYLMRLVDAFELDKKHIVASNYGTEKIGVPALFDSCYFKELSLLNQDKGAKEIIIKHAKNMSSLNANLVIADIDTKEDYERLYKEHH